MKDQQEKMLNVLIELNENFRKMFSNETFSTEEKK